KVQVPSLPRVCGPLAELVSHRPNSGPQRLVLLAQTLDLGAGGGELAMEAVDPARSMHSAAHVPAQAPDDTAFGAPCRRLGNASQFGKAFRGQLRHCTLPLSVSTHTLSSSSRPRRLFGVA